MAQPLEPVRSWSTLRSRWNAVTVAADSAADGTAAAVVAAAGNPSFLSQPLLAKRLLRNGEPLFFARARAVLQFPRSPRRSEVFVHEIYRRPPHPLLFVPRVQQKPGPGNSLSVVSIERRDRVVHGRLYAPEMDSGVEGEDRTR